MPVKTTQFEASSENSPQIPNYPLSQIGSCSGQRFGGTALEEGVCRMHLDSGDGEA